MVQMVAGCKHDSHIMLNSSSSVLIIADNNETVFAEVLWVATIADAFFDHVTAVFLYFLLFHFLRNLRVFSAFWSCIINS